MLYMYKLFLILYEFLFLGVEFDIYTVGSGSLYIVLGKRKLFCHSIHSSNYLAANPSFGAFNSFVILLVFVTNTSIRFHTVGTQTST